MISRRQMLLTTIAGLVGTALLPSSKEEKRWDRHYDDLLFPTQGQASRLPPAEHPDYVLGLHSTNGLDRAIQVYAQPDEKILVGGKLCDMVLHKPGMFVIWKPTKLDGTPVWEASSKVSKS